ncbi:MAG: hypothetical protein A2X59_13035 [Nitrospirae bacterium GWC2_42_7]|nr:MAG: hypothetical protein A2X59_13035 [Nitrospirae bacterium GWC2_42_7]
MINIQAKFVSTALGASSSMAGLLSLSKCSGSTCTSCFGCAGAGIGILLVLMYSKLKTTKPEADN